MVYFNQKTSFAILFVNKKNILFKTHFVQTVESQKCLSSTKQIFSLLKYLVRSDSDDDVEI
jgi:uncharacterized protein YlbG (UPF0298 family)